VIAPASRSRIPAENRKAARQLAAVAALLEEQGADRFRVLAYRRAADQLARTERSARSIIEAEGLAGLEALPAIGPSIARGLRDLIRTGRLPLLDRLTGRRDPIGMLRELPYVGPKVAERLYHEHGIASLEALELALAEGALDRDPWLGPKRRAALREAVAVRLGRRRVVAPPSNEPSVKELLEVDRRYRAGARDGTLPKIAPRRFNPERLPWLPILHQRIGDRDYTAVFSNTEQAHRLGRTRDWVVLYWDGADRDHHATVVTQRLGPLRGRRVVRGREAECQAHYGVVDEPDETVLRFDSIDRAEIR